MKLIVCSILFLCSINSYGSDTLNIKLKLKHLRIFAENFEPTYLDAKDTLVVARIAKPPDSINTFLQYCAENDVAEAYQFSFLIIMKLKEEFITVNKSDFDFCYYSNNGVVDLVFHAIDADRDQIGCYFTKTQEIYIWLKNNPSLYKHYGPLKRQMKKIDRLLNEQGDYRAN